jgi:hypothetical protein
MKLILETKDQTAIKKAAGGKFRLYYEMIDYIRNENAAHGMSAAMEQ